MVIRYTPEVEENTRFFEEGEGNFEIISYEEKASKSSGKLMGVLGLTIWDCKGKRGQQYDYLIPNVEFTASKIKSLLKSIGREEDNIIGEFDGNKYIGLSGKVRLKYQVDKNDPELRERVRWHYLAPVKDAAKAEAPKAEAFKDDDIPW